MPCLRRSTGDGPATSPPPGALVMHPSTAMWSSSQSDDAVVGLAGDAGQRGEHAQLDPFVAAVRRIVVAEQVVSAIAS